MTLFLSAKELNTRLVNPSANTVDLTLNDPKQISRGFRRYINLATGLDLQIDDYELYEELVIETNPFGPRSYLEFSFTIAGNNHPEEIPQGQNFFVAFMDGGSDGENLYWPAKGHMLKFDIHMDFSFLQRLIGEQVELLPSDLREVLTAMDERMYWQVGKTTPTMQMILQQIVNCPYQGTVRNLYLEGKVFELIALRLQYAFEESLTSPRSHNLRADQIELVYHARDILVARLDDPPSLMDLARHVRLSHAKLEQGFRDIFGTTVFGYLRDYRMDKARQLLYEGKISIAQIANAVGYTNPAQFSAAFKRRFGITPRECRAVQKPNPIGLG